ncbi:MAG: hypothetical protein ACP5U0_10155 [Caldisphaera sp.]
MQVPKEQAANSFKEASLPLNVLRKKHVIYKKLINELIKNGDEYKEDVDKLFDFIYDTVASYLNPEYVAISNYQDVISSLNNISKANKYLFDTLERFDENTRLELYKEMVNVLIERFNNIKPLLFSYIESKKDFEPKDLMIKDYINYFIELLTLFYEKADKKYVLNDMLQILTYESIIWAYLNDRLDESILAYLIGEMMAILLLSGKMYSLSDKAMKFGEVMLQSLAYYEYE